MKRCQKRNWITSLVLFGCLGLGLAPSAQALDFSFVGALTATNYSLSPAPTSTTMGTGFGVGATVGMDLTPFISAETGLLFLSHSFTTTSGGVSQAFSSNYVDIPVLLRISPISFIALQAGPYYGIATSVTPGSNVNDFGLLAGGSARFSVFPSLRLRTDLMYQLGLVNLSAAPGVIQNSRNLVVLVGLMLEMW